MSANGMSILESMVLSPETARKREFVMTIAPNLLAGADPSEPEAAVPDIGFESLGDEIDMIDAPEDEPSSQPAPGAPAPTNDRAAPEAPAPRAADTGPAAPTPKADTTSTIDPVTAPFSAPAAPKADNAPAPSPERKADEARAIDAPLDRRARDTATFQIALGNADNGVVGNVRPMGGAAERMATAARNEQNKKDEEFMRGVARRELQARIDKLTADLAEVRAQIAKNDERREEIRKTMEAREALRRLKDDGKFDPTDPAQRALMEAAGYNAADVQSDDFEAKSRRDDRRDANEDSRIEEDTKRLKRKEGEIAGDLDRANRDYDARYERGEALPTEELRAEGSTKSGARQVGAAAMTSERQDVKEALAEAVSSTEAASVRADSEVFTSEVVSNVAAVTNTGTADFDFDAPPAQTASADTKATDIFPTAPAVGVAFAEASGTGTQTQVAALTDDAQIQIAQTRVSTPAMTG